MRIFLRVAGGLSLLVKGHHHHRGSVFEDGGSVLTELLLPLLERDGVDDALALQTLQTGFDYLPPGGVDHERDLGHFRLTAQQLQIAGHGGDAVDHALIHADVEDIGSVLDLLPGYGDGLFVFALLDQSGELRRASNVGALTNQDVNTGLLGKRLRT